jgi:hypothetical protein
MKQLIRLLVIGCTTLGLIGMVSAQPAPDEVSLNKYLTSGPCADGADLEPIGNPDGIIDTCNIGFYGDFTNWAPDGGGTLGTLAGFDEATSGWNCAGVSGNWQLTGEGFMASWKGLFNEAPPTDCDDETSVEWYATLACYEGGDPASAASFSFIADTNANANSSDSSGAGSSSTEGTWPEPADWMQDYIDCAAPMVFLQAEANDRWIAVGFWFNTVALTDQDIAWVVETGKEDSTHYDWILRVDPNGDFAYDVEDTIPAEWIVKEFNNTTEPGADDTDGLPLGCGEVNGTDGIFALYRGGKKDKDCSSATEFWWMPTADQVDYAYFEVDSRRSPSQKGGKNVDKTPKYAPTSCGPLYLNYGADASTGDASNDLCLVAVDDPNSGPAPGYTKLSNHDGDRLSSWDEACDPPIEPTDPCLGDTDADGVLDHLDQCPNEGP